MKPISTALTFLSLVIWLMGVALFAKFIFFEDLKDINLFGKICVYTFSSAALLGASYLLFFFGKDYWKNRKNSQNINFIIVFAFISSFLTSCYPTAPDGSTYKYETVFIYPQITERGYHNKEWTANLEYNTVTNKIYNNVIAAEKLQQAYFISFSFFGIPDTILTYNSSDFEFLENKPMRLLEDNKIRDFNED